MDTLLKEPKNLNSLLGNDELSLLWQSEDLYIMDCAFAAPWCWAQSANTEFGNHLVHISQTPGNVTVHPSSFWKHVENGMRLDDTGLEEFLVLDQFTSNIPLFNNDNYIYCVQKFHPLLIDRISSFNNPFAPQISCDYPKYDSILSMLDSHVDDMAQILHIDLSSFFVNLGSCSYIQVISNEALRLLSRKIVEFEYWSCITISLNPAACGGLEPSLSTLEAITDSFSDRGLHIFTDKLYEQLTGKKKNNIEDLFS